MEKATALRCIEIVNRRTPLTESEQNLLKSIVNDIRLEFKLEGAVDMARLEGSLGGPPKEWLW